MDPLRISYVESVHKTLQAVLCSEAMVLEQDNVVPLSSLVPPLRDLPPDGLREMASQPLIPVQVDGERQFYLSLRFGIFADKAALVKVLQGTHELQNTEE